MPNGSEPATKQDALAAVKASGDRVVEAIRDSQTEIWKAFGLGPSQSALSARVGTLEDRMTELERQVNFPEHPTQ